MADNDRTICLLERLATLLSSEQMRDDLYLVSHPMSYQSQGITLKPTDYVTFNIPLSLLAAKLTSFAYRASDNTGIQVGLLDTISNDLSLGSLAHAEKLSSNTLIEGAPIVLSSNVQGAGPLALETYLLPNLAAEYRGEGDAKRLAQSINEKLGLKDLAFTRLSELDLKLYSHASALCLVDFTDISARGKIGLSTAAELSNSIKAAISSFLSLGVMAHLDNVRQTNIAEPLNFDNLITGWQDTLKSNFLSVATGTSYGSIKVGYSTDTVNKQYAVLLQETTDKAYVKVPWKYVDTATSVSFVNTTSKNTVVLQLTRIVDNDGAKQTPVITQTSALINVHIPNNITRTGNAGTANAVALFSGENTLKQSAGIVDGSINKYFRADGRFAPCPLATATDAGFMTAEDYNYLHHLKDIIDEDDTLPVATATELGAVKIGCPNTVNGTSVFPVKLNSNNQMYVDKESYVLPKASTSSIGGIKLGYLLNGSNFPVVLDGQDKAFVSVNMATLLGIIYPVGAIYITATETNTCPIAAYVGTWEKITGRYLLASGNLGGSETFTAGTNVPEGLPDHTHKVSFKFSASASVEGYPHHGSKSNCKHSSYDFTTTAASASNSIYGKKDSSINGGAACTTVRPKAFVVSVFRRTA